MPNPNLSEEIGSRQKFVALTLSGGGSRAIAFHLGCLRALNDRNILQQVNVMSTVSGGSVIGALYAYGKYSSFNEFDRRITALLRSGLQRYIVYAVLFSAETPKIFATLVVNGGLSIIINVIKWFFGLIAWTTRWRALGILKRLTVLQEALPYWGSLTTAFERALERHFFGKKALRDVELPGVEVIINASDLRTGTGFHFGSVACGGWRYGRVVNGNAILVAKAVAASAAFPLLLPPLIERYAFYDLKGRPTHSETVVLTDGGVFDNLGVSVVDPHQHPDFSIRAFKPTHIVCLNADAGEPPLGHKTLWWPSRVASSFETIYRRALQPTYRRLHALAETGQISRFIMAYLGQKDKELPVQPEVTKEQVRDYPTDFAAMPVRDIDLLTKRGEQLTRILIDRYLPDL